MVEWCRNDKVVYGSGFAAKYFSTLNAIFARDYRGNRPFVNDCASLDLDSIESDMSGNNDCTMDCAVGISKFDGNNHTQESLLLVELRYDYKSVANLERDKMSRKVKHSREILIPRRIHPSPFFLFRDNVVNEALRWVKNLSNQYAEMKSWQIVSVVGFEDIVGTESDFPYIPQTNLAVVTKEIMDFAYDSVQLYGICEKWSVIAASYKNKYNLMELNAIIAVMEMALRDVQSKGICDDPEVVAMLLDDLETLR